MSSNGSVVSFELNPVESLSEAFFISCILPDSSVGHLHESSDIINPRTISSLVPRSDYGIRFRVWEGFLLDM